MENPIGTAVAVDYEKLFLQPTIEEMLKLDPDQFEEFIAHVFTSAGFTVEIVAHLHYPAGPGVDLNLYIPGRKKPFARVEVKRWAPGHLLQLPDVKQFYGTLGLNEDKIPGYMITTGDFGENAYKAASDYGGMVRLINGQKLLRYITYIRGTRIHDAEGHLRTATSIAPDWLWMESAPYHLDQTRTCVLAVANHKGGVAKTTTALNLGAALAQRGHRVLLIDLDGQANLSAALPLPDPSRKPAKSAPMPERTHFVYEFFNGQAPSLHGLVQPTRIANLWLIPSNRELHRMDRGGAAEPGFELSFVRAVHDAALGVPGIEADAPFEYIILDTPPAQSMYTRLALAASHFVVLPINVEVFGGLGIGGVLETAATMRALVGGGVRILGCVRTRYRNSAQVRKEEPKLNDGLRVRGISLFDTAIPIDDKIEQAHVSTVNGGLRTIFGFNNSAAGKGYERLLDEVLKEVKQHA